VVGVPHGTVRPITPINNGQNFRHNNNNNFGNKFGRNNNFGQSNTLVYAYPVFVGGYDNSMVGSEPYGPGLPPSGPPTMTSYPYGAPYAPAEPPRPVMVQVAPDYPSREAMSAYQPNAPQPDAADDQTPTERYLLAFKDHTVYSAVAYWFEGDTLHYFTPGNVHNQVSVSLIDRDLTVRLNKELGIDFHMPAAK